MVILDGGYGKVEVWVTSDGERLEEHALKTVEESQNSKLEECYIASKVDKQFAVAFSWSGLTHDIELRVWVDGVYVAGACPRRGTTGSYKLAGRQISETMMRPMAFSAVTLKEDDGEATSGVTASLGIIRVAIHAGTIGANQPTSHFESKALPGEQPVNEKSKKGGAHVSRFLEPTFALQLPPAKFNRDKTMNSQEILFRYAPLDYLHARDIIPNPHPQAPTVLSTQESQPDASASSSQVKHETLDDNSKTMTSKRKSKKRHADVRDLSSGDDMTTEEREVLERVRARRLKKAKQEPLELKTAISGEIIVLSD